MNNKSIIASVCLLLAVMCGFVVWAVWQVKSSSKGPAPQSFSQQERKPVGISENISDQSQGDESYQNEYLSPENLEARGNVFTRVRMEMIQKQQGLEKTQ